MRSDLIALLAAPFTATLMLLGIHVWFGLHILRRKVVFADLALAQIAAFGATLAVALGHSPGEPTTLAYSLLFALCGAGLLTATRAIGRLVNQEALIGILYVVATAASVLVIDRAPQGAEHVRRMLVGSLLSVGPAQLEEIVPLYAAVAVLHMLARRPLIRACEAETRDQTTVLWDFVFYATFAIVVTSSVALAGVLLVFSLLIIPAVTGMLFARGMMAALLVGWATGLLASLAGFAASLAFDLPTGATLVLALAASLVLAGVLRLLYCGERELRRRNRRQGGRAAITGGLILVLVSSLWSLVRPDTDQPLLAALALLGLRPALFLHSAEATQYEDAQQAERHDRMLVDSLSDQERRARWQGAPLSDDDVWRIASYQQTYNEMGKGERFVQEHLLARARDRERWLVSLPLGILSALCLVVIFARRRLARASAA